MTTVRAGGVRFRVFPQDHEPVHAHGRCGDTVAIVVLRGDGTVELADRKDAIIPAGAKRSDVRKILAAAGEHFDQILAAWERMQWGK